MELNHQSTTLPEADSATTLPVETRQLTTPTNPGIEAFLVNDLNKLDLTGPRHLNDSMASITIGRPIFLQMPSYRHARKK